MTPSVMIELGPAKECDVVLAFLKAEVDSPRYAGKILEKLQRCGLSRNQLIDNPDLDNEQHNCVRQKILGGYRGYGRGEALFLRFPTDVYWRRIELEPQELGRLQYLREEHWMKFSEETRQPSRVVERIARGELREDPGPRIMAIQEKLRRGERFPELIAAEGELGALILIEGLSRATAYVGLGWAEKISMFLASSPSMHKWHWY